MERHLRTNVSLPAEVTWGIPPIGAFVFSRSSSSGSFTTSFTHLVNFSFLEQSEPGVQGLKGFGPPTTTVVELTADSLQGMAAPVVTQSVEEAEERGVGESVAWIKRTQKQGHSEAAKFCSHFSRVKMYCRAVGSRDTRRGEVDTHSCLQGVRPQA